MVCFVFTFWKRTSCVQSFYIRSLNCKQFIRKHELHFGLRCKISIHWILVGKAKWYFELKLDALMLWRMDISLQNGYILKASIKYTIYKIFEHLVSSTNATIMIRQCIRFIFFVAIGSVSESQAKDCNSWTGPNIFSFGNAHEFSIHCTAVQVHFTPCKCLQNVHLTMRRSVGCECTM